MVNFIKHVFIVSCLIFIFGCSGKKDHFLKREVLLKTFTVTEVRRAKYSKVRGWLDHDGMRFYIDNGHTGYYHKHYTLRPGDKFNVYIDVNYYATGHGYELVFGDVNVSTFESKH